MIGIMSCADNLAHIIIRGISLLHPPIPRRQTPIADCLQSQDRTQVTATRRRFHLVWPPFLRGQTRWNDIAVAVSLPVFLNSHFDSRLHIATAPVQRWLFLAAGLPRKAAPGLSPRTTSCCGHHDRGAGS